MSLSQPTDNTLVGTTPTPRLRIQSVDTVNPCLLNFRTNTMMVWIRHTGGITTTFQDMLAISDHGNAVSTDLKFNGVADYIFTMGDLNNDFDSNFTIKDNVWYHTCITMIEVAPTGGGVGAAFARGYVNGIEVCDTWNGGNGGSGNSATTVATPDETNVINNDVGGPAFVSLFNSRASSNPGDPGAVFQGDMAGLKMWTNVCMSPWEIRREMWSYVAVRRDGLWAESPLLDLNEAGHTNSALATVDWTVMGTNFVQGTTDPPGVSLYDSFGLNNLIMFSSPTTPYITNYNSRPFPFKPGSPPSRNPPFR